jgi:hypothetical protein
VPHPVPEIGRFAFITRDNVKMKMEDGLAGCSALVETDVETIRMKTL